MGCYALSLKADKLFFIVLYRLWRKMNAIQVISLTWLSIVAAGAQSIKPGRCPVPAVQEKFDAARVNTKLLTLSCILIYLH